MNARQRRRILRAHKGEVWIPKLTHQYWDPVDGVRVTVQSKGRWVKMYFQWRFFDGSVLSSESPAEPAR